MPSSTVRSRHSVGGSDWARAGRQQDVLVALVKKLASPSMVLQFQQVLGLAGTAIPENFPARHRQGLFPVPGGLLVRLGLRVCPWTAIQLAPGHLDHGRSSTSRLNLDKVADLSVQLSVPTVATTAKREWFRLRARAHNRGQHAQRNPRARLRAPC